jgi:hypothetical protein
MNTSTSDIASPNKVTRRRGVAGFLLPYNM